MEKNSHTDDFFFLDPKSFDRYQIISELGRGGMGKVYHVLDTKLQREVALKTLISSDTKFVRRLKREVNTMARLSHPNIVKVYDMGVFNGIYYFTMDLIKGQNLSDLLKQEKISIRRALKVMIKIINAMDYAHEQKILHRDIKPSNIMVNDKDEPYIMDFGLAREVAKDEKLSKTGEVLGTPAYMSPEQAMGKKQDIDRKSDVYSLGATLYEVLTKSPPFRGAVHYILLQIATNDPLPPSHYNRKISRELDAICLKALEKNPKKRYLSASEMANDLDAYLEGKPVKAKPATVITYFAKWVRRNFLVTMTLLAIFSTLTTISIFAYLNLERERKSAQKERKNAEIERNNAKKQRQNAQRERLSTILEKSLSSRRKFGQIKFLIYRDMNYRDALSSYQRSSLKINALKKLIYRSKRDYPSEQFTLFEKWLIDYEKTILPLYRYKIQPYFSKIQSKKFPQEYTQFSSSQPSWNFKVIFSEKSAHIIVIDFRKWADGNIEKAICGKIKITGKPRYYAVSKDDRYIAVVDDKNLYLWDNKKKSWQKALLESSRGVSSVVFSPNSKWIMTADRAKAIIYQVPSLTTLKRINGFDGERAFANSFTPDNKYVYIYSIAGLKGGLTKVEISTKSKVHITAIRSSALRFCPTDPYLVAYNKKNDLVLSPTEKDYTLAFKKQKIFPGEHKTPIVNISWSFDGQLLASIGNDGILVIWDKKSGQKIFKCYIPIKNKKPRVFYPFLIFHKKQLQLAIHLPRQILTLQISPSLWKQQSLEEKLSGVGLSTLRAWKKIPKHITSTDPITGIALSPQGDYIAYYFVGGIYLWDTQSNNFYTMKRPVGLRPNISVKKMEFNDDGSLLAVVKRKTSEIWDIKKKKKIKHFNINDDFFFAGFSPSKKYPLAVAKRRAKELMLLSLEKKEPVWVFTQSGIVHAPDLGATCFNKQGNLLFSINHSGTCFIAKLNENSQQWVVKKVKFGKLIVRARAASFCYQGRFLAIGNDQGKFLVYDWKNAKEIYSYHFNEKIHKIQFIPREELFVIATKERIYITTLNEQKVDKKLFTIYAQIYPEDAKEESKYDSLFKIYPLELFPGYSKTYPCISNDLKYLAYIDSSLQVKLYKQGK